MPNKPDELPLIPQPSEASNTVYLPTSATGPVPRVHVVPDLRIAFLLHLGERNDERRCCCYFILHATKAKLHALSRCTIWLVLQVNKTEQNTHPLFYETLHRYTNSPYPFSASATSPFSLLPSASTSSSSPHLHASSPATFSSSSSPPLSIGISLTNAANFKERLSPSIIDIPNSLMGSESRTQGCSFVRMYWKCLTSSHAIRVINGALGWVEIIRSKVEFI